MSHGKKSTDATRKYDREQQFSAVEALDLAKSLASAKFDETVELAVRLGVDPRKADQMVRGTVSLPAGTRKPLRVAAFAARPPPHEERGSGGRNVGAGDPRREGEGGGRDRGKASPAAAQRGQVGKI